MKKSFILLSLFIMAGNLPAQKDTVSPPSVTAQKPFARESSENFVNIYPVPVRADSFTIKTDKSFSQIRVTNMIGQDIYRAQFKSPLQTTKVLLDNPRRGIYLVTIIFSDGLRVVKKIMVEETE
jgi:hypothetical protein